MPLTILFQSEKCNAVQSFVIVLFVQEDPFFPFSLCCPKINYRWAGQVLEKCDVDNNFQSIFFNVLGPILPQIDFSPYECRFSTPSMNVRPMFQCLPCVIRPCRDQFGVSTSGRGGRDARKHVKSHLSHQYTDVLKRDNFRNQ